MPPVEDGMNAGVPTSVSSPEGTGIPKLSNSREIKKEQLNRFKNKIRIFLKQRR